MSEEKKEEISNAEMKVIVKENPQYRIKSILTIIVLVLILVGVIFFMGTILPEFFVFIIFLLILSLPILLLLRQKIYDFVPTFIKDSLLEIDDSDKVEKKPTSISRKYKQILALVFVTLLFIGSGNYLNKFRINIGERKSITKFLGSFVCIVLAGITLLDIENI
tara:strand:+ start:13 stop:504 length:492 start_codon:yes stop_codon:yes gene_type:complete